MQDLLWYQYALIGLIFCWSGFVRSSLGFGGAVLALPFLLPAFQAAPDGPSLTGKVRFEHDGWTNVLGPLLLLLPFAV